MNQSEDIPGQFYVKINPAFPSFLVTLSFVHIDTGEMVDVNAFRMT